MQPCSEDPWTETHEQVVVLGGRDVETPAGISSHNVSPLYGQGMAPPSSTSAQRFGPSDSFGGPGLSSVLYQPQDTKDAPQAGFEEHAAYYKAHDSPTSSSTKEIASLMTRVPDAPQAGFEDHPAYYKPQHSPTSPGTEEIASPMSHVPNGCPFAARSAVDMYPLHCRGFALIVNMETFDKREGNPELADRIGSRRDVSELRDVFTWIGFTVEVRISLCQEQRRQLH